ncbi:DUF4157 domain-containing protein [Massilia sp. W12]|uniref:eCIS core domain-containing protein n=1 Tax=Massilia sp. W12 TaxID=3126507 RepID=UPI0030D5E138
MRSAAQPAPAPAPAAPLTVPRSGNHEADADHMASLALRQRSSAPPSAPGGSGGAHAMESGARAAMEMRFGHSFADIRIHTGPSAHEAAVAQGALAYAHGNAIIFANGSYAPGTDRGRTLLAHELAHTLQQRGQAPCVQRQQAQNSQVVDAAYLLYLNPHGNNFQRSSGRYELSNHDMPHLRREHGFYFLIDGAEIRLITPPEVRRAAPRGAPGGGVLLPLTQADYAALASAPDATVARIIQSQLGLHFARLTHASGGRHDFAHPALPAPITRALQSGGHADGAAARRQAAAAVQEATLSQSGANADLPIQEIGWSDRMSQQQILQNTSAGARAEWYVSKLGRYQAQMYESAQRHHIPLQLLAVVILNELGDINILDVAQSGEEAQSGSLGIAQIQVATADAENLVDVSTEQAAAAYRELRVRHHHNQLYLTQEARQRAIQAEYARNLTPYELGIGRRRRIGRQLQAPQVAIEAAAREIAYLLGRMVNNQHSPWQRQFNFRAGSISGEAIYNHIGAPRSSQEEREGMLAMLTSGAYNSPHVIDSPAQQGFRNARIHGGNARLHAIQLYRLGLFHTRGAAAQVNRQANRATRSNRAAQAANAPAAPISGMYFDGARLTLFGGAGPASFAAVSGVRAHNPHNRDHRNHTGPDSQNLPDIGPLPEGEYYINPPEVENSGFNSTVWGPLRTRIHESISTGLTRRFYSQRSGGFFLHEDVRQDGTAGCIGLQRRADTLQVFARLAASPLQIPLEVRYPRIHSPQHIR